MSDAMIDRLAKVDLATLVIIIILVSVVVGFVAPLFTKLEKWIIDKYKKDKKEEDISKMVKEDHTRIEKYENNRIHDREQSFEIQKQLTDAINKLNARLDDYCRITDERFEESRKREDKRVRAELKDRISQYYRLYHSTGKINSMELETLKDLIAEYEEAGGDNSFVHAKVEKEMYTWEILDKD